MANNPNWKEEREDGWEANFVIGNDFVMVVTKDIKAGEEILYDYNSTNKIVLVFLK